MPELLNEKQELFCREYLIDLNASAAALRAGYSHPDYGRQLLTKPHAEERISELMEDRKQRTDIDADRVLSELAAVAFSNITDLLTWDADCITFRMPDDIPPDAVRAVAAMKNDRWGITVKLHNKLSALKLLGDHLGLFTGEAGKEEKEYPKLHIVFNRGEGSTELLGITDTDPAELPLEP